MQHLDHQLSELMRAAQDGDRLAYETLLTEVATTVRAFVRKRLHDVEGQEEVVQHTLLAGGAIHVFTIQPDGGLNAIGTLPNVSASAAGLVAR